MSKLPESPEPPIHRAARLGDLSELERLLAAGADINARMDLEVDNGPHLRRLTPLMVAARSIDGASVATLQWLLAHGADLRARSEGENTAAWYAAGKGGRWDFHPWKLYDDHAERLRFLLDAGLDPRETNFVGRSLLTESCGAGDPAAVALLLERGVPHTPEIPAPTPGSTPHEDFNQALKRLQQQNLDAAGRSNALSDIISRLMSDRGGLSFFALPLHCAASSGSAACVDLLIKAGANPNLADEAGKTPLMLAGSADVAKQLLEAGARLDSRDSFGRDVLGNVLEGGACSSGLCGPGRFDVARALLDARAALEGLDDSGKSRLYNAAFGHHDDIVDFLIALGLAPKREPDGSTALHAICWQGEYADPSVNQACERIIRALASAGFDVNARDEEGFTPLHEAVSGDWANITAVRTLLSLGAEPDPVDADGQTPLMLAASSGEVECVEVLLAAGADDRRVDTAGRKALDLALGHRGTWISLNQPNANFTPFFPGDNPQERHAKALKQAEECVRVLEKARAITGPPR